MSQIRPITEGEIEPCMALKKNAYPALDIDSAINRERILQGIRDPSFPAVYGLYCSKRTGERSRRTDLSVRFRGLVLPA
jgi:hypothetical protein